MDKNLCVYQSLRPPGYWHMFSSVLVGWMTYGRPRDSEDHCIFLLGKEWQPVVALICNLDAWPCHKVKASLHYRVKSCFKNPKQTTPTNPQTTMKDWPQPKSPHSVPWRRDWLSYPSPFMDFLVTIKNFKTRNKEKGWAAAVKMLIVDVGPELPQLKGRKAMGEDGMGRDRGWQRSLQDRQHFLSAEQMLQLWSHRLFSLWTVFFFSIEIKVHQIKYEAYKPIYIFSNGGGKKKQQNSPN